MYFFTYIFPIFLFSCVLGVKKLTCDECDKKIKPSELEFEVKLILCTQNKNNCKPIDFSKNLKGFLRDQHFNPKSNTVVIAHGFLQNSQVNWMQQMKNNFFKRDPKTNVILVDWSKAHASSWPELKKLELQTGLPFSFDYGRAALGTETAAIKIKNYLEAIANASEALSLWKHLHIIGHSLGAHMVGQIARKLKNNLLVHRITALDPAFPCFENSTADLRIKKTDAKFIDVIHTSSSDQDMKNLGIYEPIGHIDFYPNAGMNQPLIRNKRFFVNFIGNALSCQQFGIPLKDSQDLFENILKKISNHDAAPEYFVNSLAGTQYLSNKIDFIHSAPVVNDTIRQENKRCTIKTCVEMGINAEKYQNTGHRTYYVHTVKN